MTTWDEYLDGVLSGKPADVGTFAKSALGDIPPVETSVRHPTGGAAVWGEAMWAEMQRISRGEA
jgi:hypothetical protein